MLYHTKTEVIHIKIGFIGPGKVGVSLGRYFTHKGINLSGFYGRNIQTAKEASRITKSNTYRNIQEIIKESDILFITTPDDNISIIDKEIAQWDLKNKTVCHTSGSFASTALSNAKLSGASIYSVHPIFAFSSKNTEQLEKVNFSIEGNVLDDNLSYLFKTIGNPYFIRGNSQSDTYHLANVFISNLVLSILDLGVCYLKELGLNQKQALDAVFPLVEGNIRNISQRGFEDSLTGPVARGDVKTIEKHLSVLNPYDKYLYRDLSINLLKLTACRRTGIQNKNHALSVLTEANEKYSKILDCLERIE